MFDFKSRFNLLYRFIDLLAGDDSALIYDLISDRVLFYPNFLKIDITENNGFFCSKPLRSGKNNLPKLFYFDAEDTGL